MTSHQSQPTLPVATPTDQSVTVTVGQPIVTLLNIHTCLPENQQLLCEVLTAGMSDFYQHQLGFVSASIHRSLDGESVTIFTQWRHKEDIEVLRRNQLLNGFRQQVGKLITGFQPLLCEVINVVVKPNEYGVFADANQIWLASTNLNTNLSG
jgi:quinol monooxygenase YgiN